MIFVVSWIPSETMLLEFEHLLISVFKSCEIFISLRAVHKSRLTFVCTIPIWFAEKIILVVKEKAEVLKLKGIVKVFVGIEAIFDCVSSTFESMISFRLLI